MNGCNMTSNYNMTFTIMVAIVSKNSKNFCKQITYYVNQQGKSGKKHIEVDSTAAFC